MAAVQKQQISISEDPAIFLDSIKLSLLKNSERVHRCHVMDAILNALEKSGINFSKCTSTQEFTKMLCDTIKNGLEPRHDKDMSKIKRHMGNEVDISNNYLTDLHDQVNKNFKKISERLDLLKMEVEKI